MAAHHQRPSRGLGFVMPALQGLAPLATDRRPYRDYRPRLNHFLLAVLGFAWLTTTAHASDAPAPTHSTIDYMSMVFVFMLATFIGIGVIRRVSRLLHTPLMSLTNAISAIAVVGAIIVAGGEEYPTYVRVLGAIALFASMTNIVSGFLITERMLKMFKTREEAR